MTEYDNIVVAAQEHAAKHAVLCILLHYRKNGRCFIGRAFGFYAFYKSYINTFTLRYSWLEVYFSYTDGV
jgi:hypothetical protein